MNEAAKVVLVNDDPVALRLMERTLEEEGLETEAFTSAREAVAAMSGGIKPALVVADLHMPGIDGWKLCRLLRGPEMKAFNHVPILVVSATFTGVDVESITRDLGANAFLPAPYHPETLRTYARELLAGSHPQQKLEVMVVEDDVDLAATLSRAFERNGYAVTTVHNGIHALEAGMKSRYDIYVVDFHLPDTNARTLIHRLRRPDQAGVVVVITGDDDPTLPIKLLESGADGYLRKPFDPQYLLDVTQKARRERSLLRVEALLERRTAELRESDARIRALFRAIPDWVMVVNWQGLVVQANEAAFRGLPDDVPLVGAPFTDLLDAGDLTFAQDRLAATWSAGRGSFEAVIQAGGRRRAMEMAGEVTELEGDPVLLLVARDITRRREQEEQQREMDAQMQHAQRMESLGVLAGGIAHEFNNLLAGILGNTSLAQSETDLELIRPSLQQIEVSARRGAELTGQMLAFSGHSQSSLEHLSMGEVVQGVADLVRPAAPPHVRVETTVAPNIPDVEGDPSQLRQAVMNILLNALEAVREVDAPVGGTVVPARINASVSWLMASDESAFRGYVGAALKPGSYVEIVVSDSGPGLTDEELQRAFEPFFTTKFTGRGLGLSAALGIIQAHGGGIRAETGSRNGAVFRIVLPEVTTREKNDPRRGGASEPEAEQPPATAEGRSGGDGHASEPGPADQDPEGEGPTASAVEEAEAIRSPEEAAVDAPLSGLKVLVADDEPAILRMLTTIFKRGGADIYPASDGLEAWDVLQEAPDSWDLVLVDYFMPGLDGRELLDRMRDAGIKVPVLLSSGYAPEQTQEGIEPHHHPVGFLAKPYRSGELVGHAVALIRGSAEAPQEQGVA